MFVVKHPLIFAVKVVGETRHCVYYKLTFPLAEVWKNCSSSATTVTLGRRLEGSQMLRRGMKRFINPSNRFPVVDI